uniref:Signal recognition particle protein n=1 Tax=Haemonchus contortus TaxID=6289 RepID=A0A7I4YQI0_HAECO|nr:unnamed protein product [Haemonchus contortus]
MPSFSSSYDNSQRKENVARNRDKQAKGWNQPLAAQIQDIQRFNQPGDLIGEHRCVEHSMDKNKLWEKIKKMHRIDTEPSTSVEQALADHCSPFKGSIEWYVLSKDDDLAKIPRQPLPKAAGKGKSKIRMLVSARLHPSAKTPIVVVRCYSESAYLRRVWRYRQQHDRMKRRNRRAERVSKNHKKFLDDEDEM